MTVNNTKRGYRRYGSRFLLLIVTFAFTLLLVASSLHAQTISDLGELLESMTPQQKARLLEQVRQQQEEHTTEGAAEPGQYSPEPELVVPRPVGVDRMDRPTADPFAEEDYTDGGSASKPEMPDIMSFSLESEGVGSGTDLKPFGYDLFAGVPSTFAPATDIPVPVEYIIGPQDTVRIEFFGKESATYNLTVDREGLLNVPEIGPVPVAGLTFGELKQELGKRIASQMIGVKSSITMGSLRSIRIFVLGDAYRPGSYTVSALSTMTNAIFACGGVRTIGSLRNVSLKRGGKIVGTLDLYDLLIRGDTSADRRLQPGDVLFIPPIGRTVGVSGEVRRPAVYELKDESTVEDVIRMAGGYTPFAYPKVSHLERIDERDGIVVLDMDISTPEGGGFKVQNGDVIRVFSVVEKAEDVVWLSGHLYRPGVYSWKKGLRLTDLVGSSDRLKPGSVLNFVVVVRESGPDRRLSVLFANLGEAFSAPGTQPDILLERRDRVLIFSQDEDRAERLRPLIERLQSQADIEDPEPVVEVAGHVKFAGMYPISRGETRVSEAIGATGGFLPGVDTDYALLVRERVYGEQIDVYQSRPSDFIEDPGSEADMMLEPRDRVLIFERYCDPENVRDKENNDVGSTGKQRVRCHRKELVTPLVEKLRRQATGKTPSRVVEIWGFVNSPGPYPLEAGMRLSQLLRAGGGLREGAYELEAEVTRYEIIDGKAAESDHVRVDLYSLLEGSESADIELRPNDVLHIKKVPMWREKEFVEIKGEVRFPGVYAISRGETLRNVLERVGGLTDLAYSRGTVFLRERLRQKEQEQIDRMAAKLQSDLAAVTLEKAQVSSEELQNIAVMRSLSEQLKTTRAAGRLVIDLEGIMAGRRPDVMLEDKDVLVVPSKPQSVSVLGEVRYPSSHLYNSNLGVEDYIEMSGGATYKADKDSIYVVKANGEVFPHRNGWFGRSVKIETGDSVVVPFDAERIKPLTLVASISQILYQLGLAAASWNAIGVF